MNFIVSLLVYGFYLLYKESESGSRFKVQGVSVKFSSVIHLTVDNYYLRGFGLISISVLLWQVFPWGKKKLHKRLYALPGIPAYSFSSYASAPHYGHS